MLPFIRAVQSQTRRWSICHRACEFELEGGQSGHHFRGGPVWNANILSLGCGDERGTLQGSRTASQTTVRRNNSHRTTWATSRRPPMPTRGACLISPWASRTTWLPLVFFTLPPSTHPFPPSSAAPTHANRGMRRQEVGLSCVFVPSIPEWCLQSVRVRQGPTPWCIPLCSCVASSHCEPLEMAEVGVHTMRVRQGGHTLSMRDTERDGGHTMRVRREVTH